jgi:hypothetical protein
VTRATLETVLAGHAARLPGVVLQDTPAGREVLADGAVVAVLGPGTMEVRLRPAVAAAALRTPDVVPSPRGRAWVCFSPGELDDFGRDRAIAWLESAVRLAAEDDGAS